MMRAHAGLAKATLTLVAGGVLAQALPLLLGPWLTRLYTPQEFGHYTVFAAVATNVVVVACARFDQALPLAQDDAEARDLIALCLRVLLVVTALSLPFAALLGALGLLPLWPWLPLTVGVAGLMQCLTLWSTRAQRFSSLATGRVVLFGGAALAQVAAGVAQCGAAGLALGPVLAGVAASACLARPSPLGGWIGLRHVTRSAWTAAARKYREFPVLNTPHAFAGALQDTLTVALLIAWTGDASAGFWGLALRYLKAPATLVGGAVSQALYPRLINAPPDQARKVVREVMLTLALLAMPLMLTLLIAGPWLFATAFGHEWRAAGELARALSPYIGAHFIASPLSVVTLVWSAQRWALKLALVGQLIFLIALAGGLWAGGLLAGAWAVSTSMVLYFGWFFVKLPGQCPNSRRSP